MGASQVLTSSEDLVRLSSQVSDSYFPHDIEVKSSVMPGKARCQRRDIGPVTAVKLGWGAAVAVHTQHPEGFAINVPLKGTLLAKSGATETKVRSNQALLCPPDVPVSFPEWGGNVPMIGIKFSSSYLHHQLELGGVRSVNSIRVLDLSSGVGADWLAFALAALAEDSATTLGENPLVSKHLAAALASGFVAVLADQAQDLGRCSSRRVARAIDALESDPARTWTIAEIAAVSGVGVRTLQKEFRDEMGMTPIEYLRNVRLDLANDDLYAAKPGEVVVQDVAMRWGITHMGRFSTAYKERFGETPRETLYG